MGDKFEEKSPQLLPGLEKPPVPPDDRKKAGLSLGEIIKDKIGEITTGMEDKELKNKEEPWAAPGDDDFLKKDASREEKKRGDYTQVTTLSYDEVDPS